MNYLIFFFAFLFGTIIGSFLNVVVFRLKTGKISKGRSICFSCGKHLGSLELIPVVSFLVLRGRCRGCRSPISWQYPFVELLTGLLFAMTALFVKDTFSFLLVTSIFSVLMVIAVYDMRHKIIPDGLSLLFALLSFVSIIFTHKEMFWSLSTLWHVLAGPALFLPFFLVWLFSRGAWMGLGDAKLAVGIGFLLGITKGLSAIVIGIWAGALWSLSLMLLQKVSGNKKTLSMKSEIPLAPFLILGTIIAYFLEVDVLQVSVLVELFIS